jgi:histidinol-phosphate phosphatase family protein
VIPFAAVRHRVRGTVAHRRAAPWRPTARAVLFDRDGTLIHDVPYNGDPERVRPVPGAGESLGALRGTRVAVGLVTNQSGIARGLLSRAQVDAVNGRVAELLGPFDTVQVCPHGPESACPCRKPAAGMVLRAAHELGVAPWECAVVGDIGADVDAALAAGARAVLVPTDATRPEEVQAAELVAWDLREAIALVVPAVDGAR